MKSLLSFILSYVLFFGQVYADTLGEGCRLDKKVHDQKWVDNVDKVTKKYVVPPPDCTQLIDSEDEVRVINQADQLSKDFLSGKISLKERNEAFKKTLAAEADNPAKKKAMEKMQNSFVTLQAEKELTDLSDQFLGTLSDDELQKIETMTGEYEKSSPEEKQRIVSNLTDKQKSILDKSEKVMRSVFGDQMIGKEIPKHEVFQGLLASVKRRNKVFSPLKKKGAVIDPETGKLDLYYSRFKAKDFQNPQFANAIAGAIGGGKLTPDVLKKLQDPYRQEAVAIGEHIILPENSDEKGMRVRTREAWSSTVQDYLKKFDRDTKDYLKHSKEASSFYTRLKGAAYSDYEVPADIAKQGAYKNMTHYQKQLKNYGVSKKVRDKVHDVINQANAIDRANIDSVISKIDMARAATIAAPFVPLAMAAAPLAGGLISTEVAGLTATAAASLAGFTLLFGGVSSAVSAYFQNKSRGGGFWCHFAEQFSTHGIQSLAIAPFVASIPTALALGSAAVGYGGAALGYFGSGAAVAQTTYGALNVTMALGFLAKGGYDTTVQGKKTWGDFKALEEDVAEGVFYSRDANGKKLKDPPGIAFSSLSKKQIQQIIDRRTAKILEEAHLAGIDLAGHLVSAGALTKGAAKVLSKNKAPEVKVPPKKKGRVGTYLENRKQQRAKRNQEILENSAGLKTARKAGKKLEGRTRPDPRKVDAELQGEHLALQKQKEYRDKIKGETPEAKKARETMDEQIAKKEKKIASLEKKRDQALASEQKERAELEVARRAKDQKIQESMKEKLAKGKKLNAKERAIAELTDNGSKNLDDIVKANAKLSGEARKAKALEVLPELKDNPKTDEMLGFLLKAHKVGEGIPDAGSYRYTKAEIRAKRKLLKEAGFTKRQIYKLLKSGLVGGEGLDPIALAAFKRRVQMLKKSFSQGEMGRKMTKSLIKDENFLKAMQDPQIRDDIMANVKKIMREESLARVKGSSQPKDHDILVVGTGLHSSAFANYVDPKTNVLFVGADDSIAGTFSKGDFELNTTSRGGFGTWKDKSMNNFEGMEFSPENFMKGDKKYPHSQDVGDAAWLNAFLSEKPFNFDSKVVDVKPITGSPDGYRFEVKVKGPGGNEMTYRAKDLVLNTGIGDPEIKFQDPDGLTSNISELPKGTITTPQAMTNESLTQLKRERVVNDLGDQKIDMPGRVLVIGSGDSSHQVTSMLINDSNAKDIVNIGPLADYGNSFESFNQGINYAYREQIKGRKIDFESRVSSHEGKVKSVRRSLTEPGRIVVEYLAPGASQATIITVDKIISTAGYKNNPLIDALSGSGVLSSTEKIGAVRNGPKGVPTIHEGRNHTRDVAKRLAEKYKEP